MRESRRPFHRSLSHLACWLLLLFALFCLPVSSCKKPTPGPEAPTTITVWFHTGTPAEKQVMEEQVARFNNGQKEIFVKLVLIPEGEYNTQVQAAAADNSLPDLLDLDGPYLANYVWKGYLRPLEGLLPQPVLNDLLPSIIAQGTYAGPLYAVGLFDSGLGLFGNRELLLETGMRLPKHPEEAWSLVEWEELLKKLARQDQDGMVLDLRLDYQGEWLTYGFSPVLQSMGGDLVDRKDSGNALGTLNSPKSIAAMQIIQGWHSRKLVDPNTDAASFTTGRVALSWCGHWEYPRYREALGGNLLLLPLPDFGNGVKTAMGSWTWAVTSSSTSPALAGRFLTFLLQPEEILAMTRANGAIPARKTAITLSPLYGPQGPLRLFVEQLQFAVVRPRTPGYPVITSAFQEALQDIINGSPVAKALDRAARIIDQDREDNQGYRSSLDQNDKR